MVENGLGLIPRKGLITANYSIIYKLFGKKEELPVKLIILNKIQLKGLFCERKHNRNDWKHRNI